MFILPKAFYRVNAIPIKIPMTFFTEIGKQSYNLLEPQKTTIAQAVLSKKNKAGEITLPDFKLNYRAIVTKTSWYWHRKQTHRPMGQNREPKNKFVHSDLIFNKGAKSICWGKDHLFNKRCSVN